MFGLVKEEEKQLEHEEKEIEYKEVKIKTINPITQIMRARSTSPWASSRVHRPATT